MKNFGVEVRFRAYVKMTWTAESQGGYGEVTRWANVDVTDRLELRPIYEDGAFVTSRLVQTLDGKVVAVVDDEKSYKLLARALKEARAVGVPSPLQFGKKPKKKRAK